jgi:hypothetical protein
MQDATKVLDRIAWVLGLAFVSAYIVGSVAQLSQLVHLTTSGRSVTAHTSFVNTEGTQDRADYTYVVDGADYRIRTDVGRMERILAPVPAPGESVAVYYDPKRPSSALPEALFGVRWVVVSVELLVAAGLWVYVLVRIVSWFKVADTRESSPDL